MDTLAQYYNDAGQIKVESSNLSSQDFFYGTLGQYRFNESFVRSRELDVPVYSVADSNMTLKFGGGFGEPLFVVPYYNDFNMIDGVDGRKAISPSGGTDELSIVCLLGYENFYVEGDCSFGIVAKCPSVPAETLYPSSAMIECSLEFFGGRGQGNNSWDVSRVDRDRRSANWRIHLGGGVSGYERSYIEIDVISDLGNIPNARTVLATSLQFSESGLWHLYEYRIKRDGIFSFLIDGKVMWSCSHAQMEMVYLPRINMLMRGASSTSGTFALDSGWIKKI